MLTRLEAKDFRNLQDQQLDLAPGRHLVLGPNGAGKTSLLEAVYLLATTRSFRTPQPTECARQGQRSFRLAGETSRRQRLEVYLGAEGRERRINGERTSLTDHLAALPVIAWTAADGEVLSGSPEQRRRFLDRGVVGLRSGALEVVSRYRHALGGKKHLLRSGRGDGEELGVWNELLAAAAAELASLRADYVRRLAACLEEVLAQADLGLPPVELVYRPSPRRATDGPAAVLDALEEVRAKETALEQPLVGPQRDDLSIRWLDSSRSRPVRRTASAGERKALGLTLLVAHGRVLASEEVEPVVLLDDVDVELDPDRLARLWSLTSDHRQVLVTSARPAVWGNLECDFCWRVEAGSVLAA